MKMIVLAAGKGERLLPLTRNTPKPLLVIGGGSTLLETQIASFKLSGKFREAVLVIGYLGDQVEAKLKTQTVDGIGISTVFNPFYEVSNNLMSLWLARHGMLEEDFAVTNGDNLFSPDVIAEFVDGCGHGVHLAVCPRTQFDYDDMRAVIEDGHIARVAKDIVDPPPNAESPGLALVKGERARRLFVTELEHLARERQSLNVFWLEVFNRLYQRGVPVCAWPFAGEGRWQEIDFHSDVDRMKDLVRVRPSLLEALKPPK